MAEIAGLKLIVPSSVAGSGVSVSASGKVTFTAATSVSVNGCFDSTYDNYLIVINTIANGSPVDPWLYLRMRLSGTDATGSNYVYQGLVADSTTVSGSRTTSSIARQIGRLSRTLYNGAHIYLYGPSITQPTAGRAVSAAASSGAWIEDHAWTHSVSTAYDGCSISTDGTYSLTGSLTIYGLAN